MILAPFQVSSTVLDALFEASKAPNSLFEVLLVSKFNLSVTFQYFYNCTIWFWLKMRKIIFLCGFVLMGFAFFLGVVREFVVCNLVRVCFVLFLGGSNCYTATCKKR